MGEDRTKYKAYPAKGHGSVSQQIHPRLTIWVAYFVHRITHEQGNSDEPMGRHYRPIITGTLLYIFLRSRSTERGIDPL